MAVLTRSNILSNERIDKTDFDSIEKFVADDFNALMKFVFSGSSRVLNGFRVFQDSTTLVDNPTSSPVYIKLAGSTLIHSDAVGTPYMYIGSPTLSAQQVNLVASATNYVEMDLTTTTSSPDTRSFWDPSANGGKGAEFSQIVNTARNLIIQITVNQIGFTGGNKVPLAEIVLAGAVITSVKDRRNMFFRLGVGQPANPAADYPWAQGRMEPNADRSVDANAFIGADKSIKTFKEWMDAVMTSIKEVKGSANWFSNGSSLISGVNISNLFVDAAASIITGTGKFQHDAITAGLLTWTTDIFVKSIIGDQFYKVLAGNVTLADKQVAYLTLIRNQFQPGLFSFTNASTTVSAPSGAFTNFVVGDWIKANNHDQSVWRRILSFNTGVPATAVSIILDSVYTGTTVVDDSVRSAQTHSVSVANGSSVPANGDTYWLAKRDDNGSIPRLYLRTSQELIQGESGDIGEDVGDPTLAFIGALNMADSAPVYASNIRGSAGQSLTARNGVLTDAIGDEQEDRSGYLRSNELVTWDGANLILLSDVVLELLNTKTGTLTQHSLALANSPIAVANGESIWVTIDRTLSSEVLTLQRTSVTAIPAQTQANKDVIILFRRVDALGVSYLHLPFMKQLIAEGQSVRLGQSGSGSAVVKATFYDPVSTILPTGLSLTMDGVSVVNGDTILFSNLITGNNEVYSVSGVGVSIVCTAVRAFNGQFLPTDGDSVRILKGNAFADQLGVFNSITFKFNDLVRYFNGVDFWEITSLKTSTLTDNATSNIFTVTAAGSENIIVDFSIVRNGIKETGTLWLTHDGVNAFLSTGGINSGLTGVTFSAQISVGDLLLDSTLDNSGFNATLKYTVKRWSDSAGGPAGVPSYTPFLPGVANSAFVMSDNSGTPVNCIATFNVLSKTRVQLNFVYALNANPGTTVGDLEVFANGQRFPRYISGVTLDGYYIEISTNTIEFDSNLQVSPISVEIIKRI